MCSLIKLHASAPVSIYICLGLTNLTPTLGYAGADDIKSNIPISGRRPWDGVVELAYLKRLYQ